MTPVGSKPVQTYSNQSNQVDKTKAATSSELTSTNAEASALKAEQNKVTLSAEGKALLAALEQIDHESKKAEAENKTVSEKVESFAHGALGMDHPDTIEEEEDSSYSAGQYLSAAMTVGGILLALV